MQYLEKLKALKEERHLTNAVISELSGVPLATVNRIFAGKTDDPGFATITKIAIALGTSIDELAGLKQPEATPISAPIVATIDSYAELLKEKDARIRDLKEEKEKMGKEKQRFAIALACIVGFVILLLTVDILNGQFGYFRY